MDAFEAYRTARDDQVATIGMRLPSGTWVSPMLLAEMDDNMNDKDIAGSLAELDRATPTSITMVQSNPTPTKNAAPASDCAASVLVVAGVDIIDRGMGVTEQIKTSLATCDAVAGCWDRIYAQRGGVLFEMMLFLMCLLAFWTLLKRLLRSGKAASRKGSPET
jgi:hypothetical protein